VRKKERTRQRDKENAIGVMPRKIIDSDGDSIVIIYDERGHIIGGVTKTSRIDCGLTAATMHHLS
jgi:hypothetical protein